MKKLAIVRNILLIVIFCLLFFINGMSGFLVSFFTVGFILISTPKLTRMILNTGFIIFLLLVVLLPLVFDFSITLFFNNSLVVLRGMIIVFALYYLFNDVSSVRIYRLMRKYLPFELTIIVKSSLKILPLLSIKLKKEIMSFLAQRKSIFELAYLTLSLLIKVSLEIEESIIRENKTKIYFITGDKHSGKSTKAYLIAKNAISKGFKVAGIISKGHWEDNIRSGFDVVNLKTGDSRPLITNRFIENYAENIGSFYFYPEGLSFARNALALDTIKTSEIIFIDETGRLELDRKGFYNELLNILSLENVVIFIVVRNSFLEEVQKQFNINPVAVIRV